MSYHQSTAGRGTERLGSYGAAAGGATLPVRFGAMGSKELKRTMEPAERVMPPESHVDLLERPLITHFATVAANGSPRANPMWFVWDATAGVLKLTHTNERHNFRNLRREPRVAFSIVDPEDPYRYLQVRAVLEGIERDPTGAFYQSLQQRYRGRSSEVKDKDVRVILTFRPTGFKAR